MSGKMNQCALGRRCVGLVLAVLLLTSCSDDPWGAVEDRDSYSIERRDKTGRLVLHEKKINGKYDGYYRINHVGPYLVNCEGWYDMGVKVGTWRSWYDNGRLQYEEFYAPTASVSHIYGHDVCRKEILLSSLDYDVDGNVVGVTSNGVGVRVRMDTSPPFHMMSFETTGFATNYVVNYDDTYSLELKRDARRLCGVELTHRLVDGGDMILQDVSWCWIGDKCRLLSVVESTPQKQGRVSFDRNGAIEHASGDTPDFLLGVPLLAPRLSSNKLVFCERVYYDNGQVTISRLPEDECDKLQLW